MIDETTGSPLGSDVTVTLQGVTYTLRYTNFTEFKIDELGVDVPDFLRKNIVGQKGDIRIGNFATVLKLFAAMVGHRFVAMKQPVPGPDHWAIALDSEAPGKVSEVAKAVCDCLAGKIRASAVRLRESAPASAEAGLQ